MSSTQVTSLLCLMLGALPVAAQQKPRVTESYGKLPLSFEANQGQTDRSVKFLSRGSGYTLFLTEDSAVLSLHGEKANAALRMKLLGANAHPAITGVDGLPGKSNYFSGNDPKQWRTNVPTYASVKYTGVYPGIDLVYHGNQRLLEYDFVVAPGADPSAIDLRFQGATKLTVNREGALVLRIGEKEVIEHAPVVYQDIGGQRHTVPGRYVPRGTGRVGFSVAEHDRSRPLVIDPTLVYSTFLGGNADDFPFGMTIDAERNVYITGLTNSNNFPVTAGAFQIDNRYSQYAFVTKVSADGSALLYSTYLGGGYYSSGRAIAVDKSGNAYITGATQSTVFPITPGAFQTTLRGHQISFVTKLNAAGSALLYSTYLGSTHLGGNFEDAGGSGIAIDASGNAYIVGYTTSSAFPITAGAFQSTYGGGQGDGFVSKLNATGSALIFSTYLGGTYSDGCGGIAIDTLGNTYVTGATTSYNFPITPGGFQTTLEGGMDAFVTKLNSAGSGLLYSTYVGGNANHNEGDGIAVDASYNVYITGQAGPNFPTTPGAFQTKFGGGVVNAFVSKLNATGSAMVYSTYMG